MILRFKLSSVANWQLDMADAGLPIPVFTDGDGTPIPFPLHANWMEGDTEINTRMTNNLIGERGERDPDTGTEIKAAVLRGPHIDVLLMRRGSDALGDKVATHFMKSAKVWHDTPANMKTRYNVKRTGLGVGDVQERQVYQTARGTVFIPDTPRNPKHMFQGIPA